MGDVKGLVERLRAPAYWMSGSGEGHEGENIAPLEAADALEAQAARLEAAEAALRLWLVYDNLDEADFTQTGPMLHYARAIDATRCALHEGSAQ